MRNGRIGPSRRVSRLFSYSRFTPLELGLDLGGQPLERRVVGDVGLLDQQVVMRRVAPARQDQERLERQVRASAGPR